MKALFFVPVVAALFLLPACSDKIDGASIESYSKSVEKMTSKMTEAEKVQFGRDIGFASNALQNLTQEQKVSVMLDRSKLIEFSRQDLNGKTLDEIRKMAKENREKSRVAETQKLKAEIAKLEEALSTENQIKNELQKVVFSNPTVGVVQKFIDHHLPYKETNPKPTGFWSFNITVKNGSKFVIQGVDFPLNKESMTMRATAGGNFDSLLNPGETKILTFIAGYQKNSEGAPTELVTLSDVPVPILNVVEATITTKQNSVEKAYTVGNASEIAEITRALDGAKTELLKLSSNK